MMMTTKLMLFLIGYLVIVVAAPWIWFDRQRRKRRKELEKLHSEYFKRHKP